VGKEVLLEKENKVKGKRIGLLDIWGRHGGAGENEKRDITSISEFQISLTFVRGGASRQEEKENRASRPNAQERQLPSKGDGSVLPYSKIPWEGYTVGRDRPNKVFPGRADANRFLSGKGDLKSWIWFEAKNRDQVSRDGSKEGLNAPYRTN